VIANTSGIDAEKLAEAIVVIFNRRAEHAAPSDVPAPPNEWATPWQRLARDVPATDDIAEGFATAVALFAPILSAAITSGSWRAGGGWSV
jgi:hypothetical protein